MHVTLMRRAAALHASLCVCACVLIESASATAANMDMTRLRSVALGLVWATIIVEDRPSTDVPGGRSGPSDPTSDTKLAGRRGRGDIVCSPWTGQRMFPDGHGIVGPGSAAEREGRDSSR